MWDSWADGRFTNPKAAFRCLADYGFSRVSAIFVRIWKRDSEDYDCGLFVGVQGTKDEKEGVATSERFQFHQN